MALLKLLYGKGGPGGAARRPRLGGLSFPKAGIFLGEVCVCVCVSVSVCVCACVWMERFPVRSTAPCPKDPKAPTGVLGGGDNTVSCDVYDV